MWQRAQWRPRTAEPGARITEENDIYRIGSRHLLLARRQHDGAIFGYDLITETRNGARVTPISGTRLALGCFGPREASHCIITSGSATALRLAMDRPDTLVIAAVPDLSPRLADQLQRLVGARPVSVLRDIASDAGFTEQVIACLPQATLLRPRPGGAPSAEQASGGAAALLAPAPPAEPAEAEPVAPSAIETTENDDSPGLST